MRNLSGLLKIAGLEKRADPPNRGLNDPSPITRRIYRTYGYRVEPDDDVKYFYDVIVPWLKQNSETAGTAGVDYDASKFVPGFYNSVPVRYGDTGGAAAYSAGENGIVLGPTNFSRSDSTMVHELKHQQNNDELLRQSGRSKSDDALLKRVYRFTPEQMLQYYSQPWNYGAVSRESAATNAEYQFRIMGHLHRILGRRPTPQEFKDYVTRQMPADKVIEIFTRPVNAFQQKALKSRDSPEYTEEEIEAIRDAWGNVAMNERPAPSNPGTQYVV